ncbi:glutamate racemase [Clostridium folliculivorans]|uniref:Glutamate racemase n=1 Tax=Clostridium folliculivorans TaxID=2886038 RepID=A0A9W6DBK6_9CLOT|nr:glutamate racemase [Clostridium folliculivorans]GKU26027.1 glutamate racemase [Clostridium folliculivorans]GKU28113.1 glutamate racemase [Clostridium folliculivorans]
MSNNESMKPIGFFDSGVGGLSVMKKAIEFMPWEDYIYFGDAKNAPYGTKTVDEVKKLTFNATEFLINKGVKAVVIACNTATSAAIDELRAHYKNIPIIGIEPALKPAVELCNNGKIIIMATPMTLAEKKFKNLMEKYSEEAEIVPLPCAGLVELIESGITDGDEMINFLEKKFLDIDKNAISAVVLGCTHYPFVKKALAKVIGDKAILIDGSEGTAKELRRRLGKAGILGDKGRKGEITIYNSLQENKAIELSYKLLR